MRAPTALTLLATLMLLGTACEPEQDVQTDPEPPAPPATGWEEPVQRMETDTLPEDTIL